MHARSTGPLLIGYTTSLLAVRALFGGQRFGEMVVWALEAYWMLRQYSKRECWR